MEAVLGGLGAIAAAVFLFAYTQFWDVQSKLRKELRSDLGLAQGVVWGAHFAPALARLSLDLERAAVEAWDDEARAARLAQRIKRGDILDRAARNVSAGENDHQRDDPSELASALALGRLLVELEHEEANADEEDQTERIERHAARITQKGFFDRVEQVHSIGQEASRLETFYQQLGDDGTRAFVGLFAFAVLLPVSALFGLLPGAEEQDTTWVVAVTSWSAMVALVFCVAVFYTGRFWKRKTSLNRLLDEYQA